MHVWEVQLVHSTTHKLYGGGEQVYRGGITRHVITTTATRAADLAAQGLKDPEVIQIIRRSRDDNVIVDKG